MDTDELLKLPPEDRKAALRAKYGKPATPAKTYGPELPPPPSAVTRPPGAAPSPPPVVREVNLPTRGMNQTDLDQAALRAASAERSAALQQGQSVEKADERALRAREGAYTVGPGADMLGADTVARAIYGGRPVPNVVRVYGPRVEAMPMVEPTKAERDAAYRATVREMDPIKMIMGEDAAPVDLPNEQDKKWARTAMANAGLSIAGGFFGGALPVWELGTRVAGAMGADVSGIQFLPEAALSPGAAAEAVYDYGADRDVQRLARVALPPLAAMSELPDAMVGQPTRNPYKDAAETATGIASRFGLGDAAGAVRGATGIDEGETALFWDDVRPRADFDAAATEYLNGSRAAVDALPLRALPARLRTEAVDVDKWIEMAKIDPELATIAEVADNDPAAIEKQVELLPIGLIMRYQPELRPTDSDLRKAIELRHERKRWRGNESFDAIGNIMAGGLVKPVKNGNDVLFVPSAWQHALRAAGAPWAATVVEADIHPFDMVPIPGVSRPDATAQDDQSWYAKWANLRLPSVYGVESAVRSGAFNDWLDVAGLNGGTRYADLASPESTWWGRTMADIATPEYANRGYQDVFLRAGGDPNGVAADVLGAADVVMQFMLPVEEAVAAPFGAAMRGVNRGRMARRVGRELGVTSPGPAVAAMVPILSGESDALNAFGHALNEETRDLIETGAMDPAKFTPRAKDEIRDVLRAARVENPDETADLILGWLADRRARVRDTSSEVATLGGPETQKMRDSNAYKDRERDLEDMARDPANGLRPADIPIIMRELEVQALNAVDAGEVPSTEAYFQRHSWTTGVEGEVLPVDTLYQERAPRPPTLAQQIRDTQFVPTDDIVNILGADRPAYLDEVSKFILEQREKVRNGKLAPRDVAKAYLITVASQNARSQSAAGVERLLGHRLDDRFIVMDQGRRFVRPEEATAAWLAEPIGKQTLDALDRGEWFQEGWDDFMRVRDAFGSNGVRTHGLLDAAPEGQISLRNVRDAVEGINAAGGDPAQVMDVLGKMRGIGTGKAPFIGHLLGFGEMPTMDAREIAAWMTGKKVVPADAPNAELAKAAASGKPPVSKAFMQRMIDGFGRVRAASGLGADLPSETFGAIMHHWLWDRIANEATTHEGVYHTMRYASESPGVVHGSIERVVPRDENLAAFMANSVVKNADGTPMVLYHGTLSPEFETFQPLGPIEMGAHVGTAEQANVRVADKARLAEQGWIPGGDGRVMPVYVNITNPLRVPDSGFDPESILTNAMNPRYGEQAARIEAAGGRDMLAALEKLPKEQRARTLRGFLERLGYDGLVYENAAEGAGDSFAAFRPEQIKSATANVGTYDPTNPSILYSRTGGADPIERVGEVPDHRIDRIAAMAPVDPASRAEWQAGVDAAKAAFAAKVKAGADPATAAQQVRAEAESAFEARRAAAKAKDPASSMAREDDLALRGATDAMIKPLVPKKPASLKSESPGTVHGSIERVATPKTTLPPMERQYRDPPRAIPRVQYHGTTWESADKILAGGLRLPTVDTAKTNLHAVPTVSTADYPAAAMQYGPAVFEVTLRPDAKFRTRGLHEIRKGENAQLAVERWSQDALSRGEGGVRLLGSQDIIGNQVADLSAIESVRLLNPDMRGMSRGDVERAWAEATANVGTYDPTNPSILRSAEGGVTRGSISPGTPDTVNVPNPDYAAWEARVNALSAEVDALKAAPAEVPNPARAEWEAKGKATAAEVDELRAASNREMADLQARRESLQKNPRADDPDWEAEVEEVNDRIGEITRTTSVNPTLAAKEAELAAMRANPPAATLPTDPDGVVAAKAEALARLRRFKIPKEVPKPSDVSRWLIKLFRTGDVRTALHEGAHLMTLMRPKFEAEAARIFDSVDGKLTTKGHEQLADAVTRLLRGRYRPGSKVDNIAQDVLDALGDVWSRVRTLPIVDAVPDRLRAKFDTLPDAIPAEFRVMWDRELHPKAAADGVAVRLTDERQPRRFPFAVNASADAAENIAEQKAARAGKARAYGSIERDPTQVQAALGITPGMKDVDPVDLMANVIAYIGVERLRREWGAVGELKTLPSNKTAVPAERHASVLKRAKSRRDGYFMGAEPAPIQGTNDLALDANAQAGLRRLIREVEVSPLGGNVPEAFRDPNADLSRVSMDDYNRLVAEQIDLYAGYGAWREKNAALAAVPGVVRLLNNVEAWGDRGTARVVLDKVREAFVVNTLPDQMLQPFQRDVITAFERTVPEAITEVQRALLDQARKNKKGDLSFTSADLVVGLAKSMGPEVVPTDTLDVLRAAEVVLSEPDLNMLVGNASVLDELFARAPLGEGAATQMRNEVDALGFLDYVVRNAETDGTTPADWLVANRANLPEHLQAATPDDANLILADQMSVVLDGVRRRSLAVDNTGHEIALMFAGSDDETLAKKIPNDGVRRRLFRDVYEQWYSGDHTTIFDTLTDAGYVVSGPDYDQGAAVLGTILRLNIRRKVATLAARLAEAGLTGDVANLTQAGFKYDRPFSAVAVRSPRDRFRSDVVDFITAQLGWQTQAVRRDGAYKAPLGDITSMGTSAFSPEGKAAYAEAMAQIAKWGFTPGSNVVKWNQVDLGGGQRVILPDIFESAITDLVNEGAPTFMARPGAKMDARVGPVTEGAAWARTIDQEAVSVAAQLLVKTYGYSVGMLHKGMLTGLGPAIRAGYYVGNAFGGVLQLYQRMGVIGATRVLAGSAADGSMVANVMRRLHDSGAYVDEPARTGRLLPDGRYITDQMLARDAARYGLNTSQAKTEWSTTLINEIRAEEPSTWNRVVKAGLADVPGARTAARAADVALDFPRRWRRWLDEGATAIDNYYRVSTYLDGLKRGLAADEAAQVARDVAFDWNALTKFEKNVARKIILFYSFQRRNQDLFWWTFLHHPSRVTGQLRLMYGMQEANLGEDSELYVSPFNEGRIILDARPPFKDNHVALAQQGAMTMTPSTNVNAAMGLWLDLMGVATFDPVAGESLMNRLNPFIAAPLALTVGYDVRRNRKIEDTSMAVPPGVADLDYAISSRIVDLDNAMNGGLLMQALDARPVPPRDDATLDYPGQIRFEVNRENPGAVRLFWGMMNLLPVASVERNVATMSRATGAGGYEPKAGTDAVEEAGRWLGVPTESIPTRAKVVGDLRERATADTEALEREAEKGSVTSGRGR